MTISYKVVFSMRKTLSLQVKDAKLIVRAPIGTRDETILSMIEKHRDWIMKTIKKQSETACKEIGITEEEKRRLILRAKSILPLKTAYYANIMGIKYGRITITSAKTRFGSCSSKGNIAYSFRLMQYPDEAIDYVVVHELAHRLEMNHSPAFYAIVARVLPDYKKRRALLKSPPHSDA